MSLMRLEVRHGRRRQSGHAVIEIALLAPWIFFLFAGTLDMGFYLSALIATQNAARVAAEYSSSNTAFAGDSNGACQYVLAEMKSVPNVRGLTTCGALPLKVQATPVPSGADGSPASSVSVTYQSDTMFAIPFLTGRLTVTRIVQMRMRDS